MTVDPEIAAAVDRTAKLCSDLGHDVTETGPVIDAEAFGLATQNVWCAFITLGVEALAAVTGRKPGPDTLEASSLACFAYGKSLTAADPYRAEGVMNRVSRRVGAFFTAYEVLLTRTIDRRPVPIDAALLRANA